jgi:hypothetical protein
LLLLGVLGPQYLSLCARAVAMAGKSKKKGRAAKRKSKNFIQKAVGKHRGVFRKYCEKKGFKGASKACDKYALTHHTSALTKKRANLAETLAKLRARRRH